jgi:hypothetical protein
LACSRRRSSDEGKIGYPCPQLVLALFAGCKILRDRLKVKAAATAKLNGVARYSMGTKFANSNSFREPGHNEGKIFGFGVNKLVITCRYVPGLSVLDCKLELLLGNIFVLENIIYTRIQYVACLRGALPLWSGCTASDLVSAK